MKELSTELLHSMVNAVIIWYRWNLQWFGDSGAILIAICSGLGAREWFWLLFAMVWRPGSIREQFWLLFAMVWEPGSKFDCYLQWFGKTGAILIVICKGLVTWEQFWLLFAMVWEHGSNFDCYLQWFGCPVAILTVICKGLGTQCAPKLEFWFRDPEH